MKLDDANGQSSTVTIKLQCNRSDKQTVLGTLWLYYFTLS